MLVSKDSKVSQTQPLTMPGQRMWQQELSRCRDFRKAFGSLGLLACGKAAGIQASAAYVFHSSNLKQFPKALPADAT